MIPQQQLSKEQLQEETLRELEFPKLLQHIAQGCVSELGKEIILQSRPDRHIYWVQQEHERQRELWWLLEQGVPLAVDTLEDIRPLLAKARIQDAFLTPSEILKVRDVIRLSRLIKQEVLHYREAVPHLAALCSELYANRLLERHIREVIDDTAAVRDQASAELRAIRTELLRLGTLIRQKVQRIMRRLAEDGVLSDEFVTQREGRYVIPVRVEHKGKVPGIMHGVSKSGMTVFVEPASIVELNNELAFLHDRERREIERILRVLTAEIAAEADRWQRSLEILGHLDALHAKVRFARTYGGEQPELTEDPELRFAEVYHPLLVIQKGKSNVVPLSITFSEEHKGFLISGPNAGGKTVALKTIGLAVAMALSGIYPLGRCRLRGVQLFASIGDHQSLEQDLSTFSSQMLRLRHILEYADDQTLVLIDEIAAGTDPQEGAALAMGVMEVLLEKGAFLVVTTHQSSLKSYAMVRPQMANASMEFDSQRMEPTYRLLPHVPGNSYAFVLAEKIGLPPQVLEKARSYLGSEQHLLEDAIAQVQRQQQQLEQLKQQVAEERKAAERKRQQYEERFEKFRQKYRALMEAAQAEAQQVVADARRLIEQTVRELRENRLQPREAHRRIQQLEKQLQSIPGIEAKPVATPPPPAIRRGATVRVEDMTTPGVVQEVYPEKQLAVVEVGNVRMKVGFEKLQVVSEKEAERQQDKRRRKVESVEGTISALDANATLDVRGYFPEEALLEVDHFIARALLSPLKELTIIHGKGTGALRERIHQFLRQHPSVASFRIGNELEGGAGVTIVELK